MKTLFASFLTTAVLVTRAWSVDFSTNFVDYTVQINGRPARMIFVSSFGDSLLWKTQPTGSRNERRSVFELDPSEVRRR